METFSKVLVSISSVVILIGVIVGGYLLGWWLEEDSVNRQGEIRRDSFEVQETARDEVLRQWAEIEKINVDMADPDTSDELRAALLAQRSAAISQLCNVASDISGSVTPAVDKVIAENC